MNSTITPSIGIHSTSLQTTTTTTIEVTPQNPTQNLLREKVWNYWKSSSSTYSKIVGSPSLSQPHSISSNDSMEIVSGSNLVRNGSRERISNGHENDSLFSNLVSENNPSPSSTLTLVESNQRHLFNNTSTRKSSDFSDDTNDNNTKINRNSKFIGFSLNLSNNSKNKKSSKVLNSHSKCSKGVSLFPFIDDQNEENTNSTNSIHLTSTEDFMRSKRSREEVEIDELTHKKQRIIDSSSTSNLNTSFLSSSSSSSLPPTETNPTTTVTTSLTNTIINHEQEKQKYLYHIPNIFLLNLSE